MQDVVVIGGSFAGLAAAMQLGRARRKVIVLDTGLNRNRYAEAAHNLLGHDGTPPGVLLEKAREQVQAYPTVKLVSARAEKVSGEPDAFRVETDLGDIIEGRRVILSYGIVDEFPAIPGFAESWGQSVIHCPFCHGYEVAGKRWGLVYSSPMSLHATSLYGDWTDKISLFLDGHSLIDEERSKLEKRRIEIYGAKLAAIDQVDGWLRSVKLEDGTHVDLDALYAHPRNRPSSDFHTQLGLETKETPTGIMLAVDERGTTSRPGIYAAGDLVSGMHSISFAMASASVAAIGAQSSMLV
jgi:thioredoxin reductase